MTNIESMIDKDGNKLYAFVMLLMINELYVSASIILAESIKNSGCVADLVILIDNSISEKVEQMLKKFYDKVIRLNESDIIKSDNDNQVQKYIGTKLYALKLNYKKVAIIDVDSIIFDKSNEIFNYNVPACVYSNTTSKYNTGLILLEPKETDYINLKNIFESSPKSESKPLLYSIIKYYDNLYKIDEKYLKSNSSVDAYGIQYNVSKPFIIKNKISLDERATWEYFKLWYLYFRNIITKYPELKEYDCLKEPLFISKYFLNELGRYTLKYRHTNKKRMKEQVKEIYGKTESNPEYYHLNISKEYDSDDITYLLNNFTIDSFIQYIKNKTNLLDKYLMIDIKTIQQIIKLIEPQYILEYILTEYIRTMNNVFIILFVRDVNVEEEFELTSDLKENLIYKKSFIMAGLVLKNILFNVHQNMLYDERVKLLSMYSDYSTYEANLLVYQTESHMNLSYQKHKIFIFNDVNSKIRLSSIFFNSNTLSRYNNDKIKLINNDKIDRKSLIKLLNFQTIKKWLYNNYSGDQLNNIIVIKYKKFTILDNNDYNLNDIKRIKDRKIDLIDVVFSKEDNTKKLTNYKKIISHMYNPKKYWELEGIKIYNQL